MESVHLEKEDIAYMSKQDAKEFRALLEMARVLFDNLKQKT